MRIGYARVSTEDQSLDLQLAALETAGCCHIFKDSGISGSEFGRPVLRAALSAAGPGATLVVWKLDRLGRSLVQLVQTINQLEAIGADLCSLTEEINTKPPGGRLIFHLMAALAEFERSLISERTRAGMNAARARGSSIGRPPALTPEQTEEMILAVREDGLPITALAKRYNVHPRTIHRLVTKMSS
ncbi:MAG: recombinase family protein [Alphaproteobacteria bacterium]|nr:recombinase family protein [Alphaproteobacteria bacterium]